MSNSIEKYLQQIGLSKSTIKCYNDEILEFIVWCDTQHIEPEEAGSTDITAYLQHLQHKGQHNKTRNINLNILKHYFDYQVQHQKREDNPARQIKIRGAKTKNLYPIFTKQELETLYHSYTIPETNTRQNNPQLFAQSQLSKKRNKAILSLMIYQGLTTDEINRLSLNDIQLKQGTIFIAGTRKSNERILELKPHQIMELMEYQLSTRQQLLVLRHCDTSNACDRRSSNLYFIPTPSIAGKIGKNEDGINIWKRFTQELKTNNKKFINFLQVRASVITHWLGQHNLRQVQYMAGHRYVSSTESYLSNNIEDLQKDIDNFHPIG